MFILLGAFQTLRNEKRIYGEMLDEIRTDDEAQDNNSDDQFYSDITIREMIKYGMYEALPAYRETEGMINAVLHNECKVVEKKIIYNSSRREEDTYKEAWIKNRVIEILLEQSANDGDTAITADALSAIEEAPFAFFDSAVHVLLADLCDYYDYGNDITWNNEREALLYTPASMFMNIYRGAELSGKQKYFFMRELEYRLFREMEARSSAWIKYFDGALPHSKSYYFSWIQDYIRMMNISDRSKPENSPKKKSAWKK